MQEDDFNDPDFESHDSYEDSQFLEDEHEDVGHQQGQVKSATKSKLDIKKLLIPGIAIVAIGGLIVEGGNLKKMIMGQSSNTPIHHTLPHNGLNNLPHRGPSIPSPNIASNPDANPLPVSTPDSSPLHTPTPAIQTPPAITAPSIPSVTPPVLQNDTKPAVESPVPVIPNKTENVIPSTPVVPASSESQITSLLNTLNGNTDKITSGQKDIENNIDGAKESINSHIDEKEQILSDKIDALTKTTNDIQTKLDTLNKPVVTKEDNSKGIVLGHHSKKHHPVHVIPKAKAPVAPPPVHDTIASYHLIGISKHQAQLLGSNGKYETVDLGSIPKGHIGSITGQIQGIGKNDNGTWFLQTANGRISE